MYGGEQGQREGSLEHWQGLHRQVESDIHDNNAEIKLLNNKIVKNDYDRTLLLKLEARREALLAKHKELQDIVRNQELLQREVAAQRRNEVSLRQGLGSQYLQVSEERKRKAEEERRRMVEQERQMHEYHRRAMEEEQLRRKQVVEEQKKSALQQLAMREQARAREREEKEREKEEYNKKVLVRSQIQTQKDSVYKQYYHQFLENQEKLHSIYNNKAALTDRQRDATRAQFQRKEIEAVQQRIAKEQEQRAIRITEDRDMLRSFLQNQIEEKNRKKSREKEEELQYQAQVSRFQLSSMEAEQIERARRKEQQRKYDQELKLQTRIKAFSTEGSPASTRNTHNPITNPIDFKIGITNPYIIREYEQTKEKYLGDPQLKLRNLAMVGSSSLQH